MKQDDGKAFEKHFKKSRKPDSSDEARDCCDVCFWNNYARVHCKSAVRENENPSCKRSDKLLLKCTIHGAQSQRSSMGGPYYPLYFACVDLCDSDVEHWPFVKKARIEDWTNLLPNNVDKLDKVRFENIIKDAEKNGIVEYYPKNTPDELMAKKGKVEDYEKLPAIGVTPSTSSLRKRKGTAHEENEITPSKKTCEPRSIIDDRRAEHSMNQVSKSKPIEARASVQGLVQCEDLPYFRHGDGNIYYMISPSKISLRHASINISKYKTEFESTSAEPRSESKLLDYKDLKNVRMYIDFTEDGNPIKIQPPHWLWDLPFPDFSAIKRCAWRKSFIPSNTSQNDKYDPWGNWKKDLRNSLSLRMLEALEDERVLVCRRVQECDGRLVIQNIKRGRYKLCMLIQFYDPKDAYTKDAINPWGFPMVKGFPCFPASSAELSIYLGQSNLNPTQYLDQGTPQETLLPYFVPFPQSSLTQASIFWNRVLIVRGDTHREYQNDGWTVLASEEVDIQENGDVMVLISKESSCFSGWGCFRLGGIALVYCGELADVPPTNSTGIQGNVASSSSQAFDGVQAQVIIEKNPNVDFQAMSQRTLWGGERTQNTFEEFQNPQWKTSSEIDSQTTSTHPSTIKQSDQIECNDLVLQQFTAALLQEENEIDLYLYTSSNQ